MDTQNTIPFFLDSAEICIFPSKESLVFDIIKPIQRHTNNIIEIIDGNENLENCDGVYTKQKGVVLGIGTSDCAPICFISKEKVGIVHCGWRGLVNGILENMQKNFTEDSTIYVGPFLHRFEIQKDFCFEQMSIRFGEEFFTYQNGKIFFEFKNALASVIQTPVIFDTRSTDTDISLPSHRRGDTYNFITTVRMY